MTSTAPGAHPRPEEVDALLDPSGGDAQVAAHVGGCARCGQVREDLRAVRALLGAQARTLPPEPPDLGARIAAALAAEPPLRPSPVPSATDPGTDPAGDPAGDPPADPAAGRAPAATPGWDRSEGGQVLTLPPRRRRWPAYLAVAASVAVVGVGGTLLVGGLDTLGSSDAGSAAGAPQQADQEVAGESGAESGGDSGGGAAAPTSIPPGAVSPTTGKAPAQRDAEVRASGTDYTRAGLAAQVEAFLRSGAGLGVQDTGSEAFDASTQAACLAGVGRSGAEPVAADVATFEDEPATVLVLQAPPGYDVLVVPAGCGRGDDRVLASTYLDRP